MASQKQLISAITDELSDTSSSLAGPMLKIKILASRLDNQELVDWIDKEIQGYPTGEAPEYRNAKPRVHCTLIQGYTVLDNQPFPIMFLNEKWLEFFTTFHFNEGIEALEHIARRDKGDTLHKPFGADFDAVINKHISREKPQNFRVHNIAMEVHISQVTNIISTIRNKLITFTLNIEKSIKHIEAEDQVESVANQAITQFMTQIHITSSGTGNTINTGDKNMISVTNNISKGDISALKEVFRSQQVPEENINEIATIVDIEPYDEASKSFGTQTKAWISKMMSKAIDGSWQIGIGTAGTLLAEGIKAYYGVSF